MVTVGVLALQGAFAKHLEHISKIGARGKEVKKPKDLANCDALILPGGESTTLFRQIDWIDLREPLCLFAKEKPVFGTCAGLILMATRIVHQETPKPYGLIDVVVERNGYGRQIESFKTTLVVPSFAKQARKLQAIFIRAPKIHSVGPAVEVLARHLDEPVLIKQGKLLAATFHPELTDDLTIHTFFLKDLLR